MQNIVMLIKREWLMYNIVMLRGVCEELKREWLMYNIVMLRGDGEVCDELREND